MNSQIVLKGIESEGCVLVAASSTRILNRLHTPVWSKGELFNKKTWVGNVENLQVTMNSFLITVYPLIATFAAILRQLDPWPFRAKGLIVLVSPT